MRNTHKAYIYEKGKSEFGFDLHDEYGKYSFLCGYPVKKKDFETYQKNNNLKSYHAWKQSVKKALSEKIKTLENYDQKKKALIEFKMYLRSYMSYRKWTGKASLESLVLALSITITLVIEKFLDSELDPIKGMFKEGFSSLDHLVVPVICLLLLLCLLVFLVNVIVNAIFDEVGGSGKMVAFFEDYIGIVDELIAEIETSETNTTEDKAEASDSE